MSLLIERTDQSSIEEIVVLFPEARIAQRRAMDAERLDRSLS